MFIADGLHRALQTAHNAQRATDLLLQEISHRVKNKFAMVSSIISLQARRSSPEVRSPEKALSAGAIVNELVTNAVKYAFEDGPPGNVRVDLMRAAEGLGLSVTDDGEPRK